MTHVKTDQVRRNPLFLIFILCALTTPAKALNFTNSYENWPLTVSDHNLFFESNETNNDDQATVSTAVDVALSIEVAAPPVCHSMEYRSDASPPGDCSWLDIPYRADIVNLDPENTAPRVDIVLTYDDMWTGGGMTSQQVIWSDSLPPQGSYAATFHLDIPTDASCSGPLGDTDAWFIADGNAETLNDVDRDNNSVALVINDDYWWPD